MAYRRPDNGDVFSSRWRLAHRDELAACGIPDFIRASDQRWRYVLLHGDDLESGWSAASLSDEQARRLLALLEPLFPNPVGVWLVEALAKRFASRDRPGVQ